MEAPHFKSEQKRSQLSLLQSRTATQIPFKIRHAGLMDSLNNVGLVIDMGH